MTVNEFRVTAAALHHAIHGLLERAPADQLDWRPVATVLPLGQLLSHLATSLTPVVEIALTGQYPPPSVPAELVSEPPPVMSPSQAAATVLDMDVLLGQLLADVSDEDWRERQVSVPWGKSGSLAFVCEDALDHAAGHRYQLFLYLKILGQPLTTAELYGMGG